MIYMELNCYENLLRVKLLLISNNVRLCFSLFFLFQIATRHENMRSYLYWVESLVISIS